MQHALKLKNNLGTVPQPLKRELAPAKNVKKSRKTAVKSHGVFNIIMLIAIACFSIALARVVQYALYNQYALENEQLKQRIASSRQISEELSSRKLTLESPQRIQAFAAGQLKMIKPESIRYIVYKQPEAPKLAYVRK